MGKPNILIVDDKENNLVALEITLEETGAEFVRASSGNDALRMMLRTDFALAILDVQMPEMDGYELAQLIRSREQTKHLPIIFVSAVFSDDFHIFKGYDSGAVDFIAKPFEPKILINKVQVFLELYNQKKKSQQIAELYEKTFNAITDVVMILDESMGILQVNKSGCSLLGLAEEEIVGKYCYEIFHGSEMPCPDCRITDHNQKIHSCTWEIYHEKLDSHFLLSSSPLIYGEEEALLTVYVARDISEQKKIKEQLLQSEKLEAIGTLAGGIAHDFNNILSAVLGYTELSLLENALPPVLEENLYSIKKAGERAKELVFQILTFSRKSYIKRSPILIVPILKEVMKLLRATIPTTVEIKSIITADQEKILADPIEIHQIIMNICTNSFQAMEDEQGVIEISLLPVTVDDAIARSKGDLQPGDYLCLKISDTGKGIEKELQSRIFDPFFTTKEKEQGTGMGLSVVHGIISHCGGAITVESEPDKGAVFEIFLPVIQQTEEETTPEVSINPTPGSGHILFVDDEPNMALLGERYLEYLGYTAVTAASGTEALALFEKNPAEFTAVITDQTMPGLPGNQLAQKLIQIRPDIPVVLCTGYSTVVSEEKALLAGISAYLLKPISLQTLADTLHKIIQQTKS